jgi:hypothetical protein
VSVESGGGKVGEDTVRYHSTVQGRTYKARTGVTAERMEAREQIHLSNLKI